MAAEDSSYYMPYQYGNQANPSAHYNGTAPEILEELDEVSAFVAGLGTGGTLMGVGRRLREELGDAVKIVAAEPMQGEPVQGLRSLDDGFIPPIIDLSLLDRKIFVTNHDAIVWTKKLLDEEGIFAGVSTGAIASIAVRIAERARRGQRRLHRLRRRLEVPLLGALHDARGRAREPGHHGLVVGNPATRRPGGARRFASPACSAPAPSRCSPAAGRPEEPEVDAAAVLAEQLRAAQAVAEAYARRAGDAARERRRRACSALEAALGARGRRAGRRGARGTTGLEAALAAESAALRAHVAAIGQLADREYRELLAGLVTDAAASESALLVLLERPPLRPPSRASRSDGPHRRYRRTASFAPAALALAARRSSRRAVAPRPPADEGGLLLGLWRREMGASLAYDRVAHVDPLLVHAARPRGRSRRGDRDRARRRGARDAAGADVGGGARRRPRSGSPRPDAKTARSRPRSRSRRSSSRSTRARCRRSPTRRSR